MNKIYQFLANKIFPQKLIWYCVIRAWAMHQARTGSNKLPSQVLVVDLLKRLDGEN